MDPKNFYELQQKYVNLYNLIYSIASGKSSAEYHVLYENLLNNLVQVISNMGKIAGNNIPYDFLEQNGKDIENLEASVSGINNSTNPDVYDVNIVDALKEFAPATEEIKQYNNAEAITKVSSSFKGLTDKEKNEFILNSNEFTFKLEEIKKERFEEQVVKKYSELAKDDYRAEYEEARKVGKQRISEIYSSYRSQHDVVLDNDLKEILDKLNEYSRLEANSSYGEAYDNEVKILKEASKKLDKYINEIEEKSQADLNAEEEKLLLDRERIAVSIKYALDDMACGNLQVPKEGAKLEEGEVPCHFVHAEGDKVFSFDKAFEDAKDVPLFPHEPCPEDIKQGPLGDCYMLSSLSAIAKLNPNAIKDMMVDNGNGTVTVRFYGRPAVDINDPNKDVPMEPIYVTVDKLNPTETGAYNCLWVQTIERAYAASGIRQANNLCGTIMPANINKLYEDYSKMDPKNLPSHADCPWLIGPDGKLHKFAPTYDDIEGGQPIDFLEHVLGDKEKSFEIAPRAYYKSDQQKQMSALRKKSGVAMRAALAKQLNIKDNIDITPRQLFNQVIEYFGLNQLNLNKDVTTELSVDLLNALSGDPLASYFEIEDTDSIDPGVQGIRDNRNKINKGDFSFIKVGAKQSKLNELEEKKKIRDINQETANTLETRKKAGEFKDGSKDDFDLQTALHQVDNYNKEINALTTEISKMPNDDIFSIPGIKEKIKTLINDAAERLPELEAQAAGYGLDTQRTFKAIQESVKENNTIIASTTHSLNKNIVPGLFTTHAYTVLGAFDKEIDGHNYKFVRIRNPHGGGGTGFEYKLNDDKKLVQVATTSNSGYCDIELNDFMNSMESLHVKGKGTPSLLEFRNAELIRGFGIDKDCVSVNGFKQYFAAINAIKEGFNSTKGGIFGSSSQFNRLTKVLKSYNLSEFCGDRFEDYKKTFGNISACAQSYLDHCYENKRLGSRRANRMKFARATKAICDCFTNKVQDPEKALKEKIADTFLDALKKENEKKKPMIAEAINANRDFLKEHLFKDKNFAKVVEGKNIIDLAVTSTLGQADMMKVMSAVKFDFAALNKQPKEHIKIEEHKPVQEQPNAN